MCGIAGLVDWAKPSSADPGAVAGMIAAMKCRGPDGEGVWSDGVATLGHVRLAVIDLHGGRQPMQVRGRDGRQVAVTFSGEIYNYRELREELRGRGHDFVTQSDTEVVLRAYLEWGDASVDRLVGMFAYALWDPGAERLLLIRDRLGVKPLYFHAGAGGSVLWGSELKALLAHPDVTPRLGTDGVAQLFCLAPNHLPGTAVLDGIEELRPGTMAVVTRDGIHRRTYWHLEAQPHDDDLPTTVARIRDLVIDAVHSQTHADVPVGSLLSGGLDSSLVASLAADHMRSDGRPLRTFALDYSDPEGVDYSASSLHAGRDTPYAEAVAKHIGSTHITHYVSLNDMIDAHDDTLRAMDLPSYSPVTVSLLLLFRRVSEEVPVVLSGEAADELFGGYHWHQELGVGDREGFPWHQAYPPLSHLIDPAVRHEIQPDQYLLETYRQSRSEVPALPGESLQESRWREVRWHTNQFYLRWLLHRKDRISMAAGVEARVPFCDHRLVEYAWNIPWAMHQRIDMEKGLLRQAAQPYLPQDVAWRRKSGYPAAQTVQYQKYLWDRMRDVLASPQARLWTIADPQAVRVLLGRRDSGWTALMHIAYLLEIDAWMDSHRLAL